MKCCSPNIEKSGRWLRGVAGLSLILGALFLIPIAPWASVVMILSAAFLLFEALRGWCALRACGIKTKF